MTPEEIQGMLCEGVRVEISLSDAMPFTGIIKTIQVDENFGNSYEIVSDNGTRPMWVSIYRISDVL